MSNLFNAHPAQVPPDRRYKLGPVNVDIDDAKALAQIADATGAPASWHRRQALHEYVVKHGAGGESV